MFIKNKIYYCIFILFVHETFASSWTRNKGEIFSSIEFSAETNNIDVVFYNKKVNYYKNNYMQFYSEYGLSDTITIGGYLKNYNFYSIYYDIDNIEVQKINNDIYSNIFLNKNLYKTENNSISVQYSLYLPIKYKNISKKLNFIDTSVGNEIKLSFGHSNNFLKYLNYYIEFYSSYRLINNAKFDEITFNATLGITRKNSSAFVIQYEYNYYPESLLINKNKFYKYSIQNNNKITLTNIYDFNNKYSLSFSYSKSFYHNNADSISIAIIFK